MDIMPCLRTEGLIVGYDGKPLIKDVNIDVLPGRIVTLIGPNGAGKSTILKTVTGYLEPLGGAVYLSGKPLSELTPHERSLQFSVLLTATCKNKRKGAVKKAFLAFPIGEGGPRSGG